MAMTGEEAKYPVALYYILPNELGERFCFLGLWLLTNQYLKGAFGVAEARARELTYLVGMLLFGFPLVGAAVADCYLGKYRTIVWFSALYMLGNLAMTLVAIPGVVGEYGHYPLWAFVVPAALIAAGSGGLKPCVAPHGADQFADHQQASVDGFYMAFFVCINLGSVLVHLTLPVLSNAVCFGNRCYFLAFLVPTLLFGVAVLVFVKGACHYRRVPACGEFLPLKALWACVYAGTKYLSGGSARRARVSHWLDAGLGRFSPAFLSEVRQVGQVCVVFVPITVLWMLDLQTTVEWQNQFELMNHTILGVNLPTEASSFLSPILVTLLMPLLAWVVLPLLARCNVRVSAVGRMALGFGFIIASFVLSNLLQYYVVAHAGSLVKQNNVAVACPGCVSGLWQLPQQVANAVGDVLIAPASHYFSYSQVSPRFRSQSNAIFLFTYSLASFGVLVLDVWLVPLGAINRIWAYVLLATAFFGVFLSQAKSSAVLRSMDYAPFPPSLD